MERHRLVQQVRVKNYRAVTAVRHVLVARALGHARACDAVDLHDVLLIEPVDVDAEPPARRVEVGAVRREPEVDVDDGGVAVRCDATAAVALAVLVGPHVDERQVADGVGERAAQLQRHLLEQRVAEALVPVRAQVVGLHLVVHRRLEAEPVELPVRPLPQEAVDGEDLAAHVRLLHGGPVARRQRRAVRRERRREVTQRVVHRHPVHVVGVAVEVLVQ
mmetsp:Transcript_22065/g.67770  ORF Transcript_22065/g.67770 Transcript_22065/m.67770 type:complete len:219 (-) Transcript_22065:688-1344(-)